MTTCSELPAICITAGDFKEVGFHYNGGDISAYVERKMYVESPSSPGGQLVYDAIDVDFAQGDGKFVIARGDLVDVGSRVAEIKLGETAGTIATSQKFVFNVEASLGPTA